MSLAGKQPPREPTGGLLDREERGLPSLRQELEQLELEVVAARAQVLVGTDGDGRGVLEELERRRRQVQEELARQDREIDRILLAVGAVLAGLAVLCALLGFLQARP